MRFSSSSATQLTLEGGRHPGCSFIAPPGQGFLPRETALHHQDWAVRLVQQALAEAKVSPQDISVIAFTKVRLPIWLRSITARDALQMHMQQGAWRSSPPASHEWSGQQHFAAVAPVPHNVCSSPCAGAWHGRSPCVLRRGCPHAVAGKSSVLAGNQA